MGNLTADALTAAVHARLRPAGRSPLVATLPNARLCREAAERDGLDLRVVELNVTSQESGDVAVAAVLVLRSKRSNPVSSSSNSSIIRVGDRVGCGLSTGDDRQPAGYREVGRC
jgi:hypothetical protein